MPKVEWNKKAWDGAYDWQHQGDEWSQTWGGPCMQWYGTILPRIHAFVPAPTILEIAPGYGRWTQFLKGLCDRLIVVDLSESCIEACRQRFSDSSHISYHVNDGMSLDMIADNAIDFVFTFDSLVHADDDVLSAYMSQLARKLTANGVAFIHHSNLGEYEYLQKLEKLPGKIQNILKGLTVMEDSLHFRSRTMTAAQMKTFATKNGLECISQELVPWGTRRVLLDCLSTVVKNSSIWSRENRVLRNESFMDEARYLSRLSGLYRAPNTRR